MNRNISFVTEIPSSLKQLARFVVRMFYSIEDTQIIDMLVRSPCIKEGDMCELLRYDRKMLRSRIATLKNDKFLQTRLRMETGPDGKAQKVNCYFINYRSFANMVKYKLDYIRKKMEAVERDATSRTSFVCIKCSSTFTDLEADRLFDISSGEFKCTFCYNIVEEDLSSINKHDTRLMMIKYNTQMDLLFKLLGEAEGLKLSPELLEPEPIDIADILGLDKLKNGMAANEWSGEATRRKRVNEPQFDVIIGDKIDKATPVAKERPAWLTESTVVDRELLRTSMVLNTEQIKPVVPMLSTTALTTTIPTTALTTSTTVTPPTPTTSTICTSTPIKNTEDIMSVLLQYEKRSYSTPRINGRNFFMKLKESPIFFYKSNESTVSDVCKLSSDISKEMEDEDEIPSVMVGDRSISLTEIDDAMISEMTQKEKYHYIQAYQEYYSPVYE